jgi:hypothetical protein
VPVTASEFLFFCGGVAVGVAATKAYPHLKPKLEPLLANAEGIVGETYSEAARKMAERIEAIYDAMAEIRRQKEAAEGAAAAAAAAPT